MIEQNTLTIIFGVFLLLTCRDLFLGQSSNDADTADSPAANNHHNHHHHHHEAIDQLVNTAGIHPSPANNLHEIQRVKIQYCHSCGYRQAFDEISKVLQSNFPGMLVEGEYHQPNWLRSQIVNLLFISKIAVLAMIYLDFNPFTYLQMDTPRLWTTMTQSKISSSLIILFMANSIESNMMSTGAFEIFYNGVPVWSKLHTGRMPSGPELLQMISGQSSFGDRAKGTFRTDL